MRASGGDKSRPTQGHPISRARSRPHPRRGLHRRLELNQKLKKGDRLLVMEAMKMQARCTRHGGDDDATPLTPGQQVEAKICCGSGVGQAPGCPSERSRPGAITDLWVKASLLGDFREDCWTKFLES